MDCIGAINSILISAHHPVLPGSPRREEGSHVSAYSGSESESSFNVKSSQISFIARKIRKIGEASADTTETYYMKGYYNLEEEPIKVKI